MDDKKEDNNKNKGKTFLFNAADRVAVIAAVFAVILSLLLVINYIQTKSADPLNSKAISQLMLQHQEEPENTALIEQIRALDLLARKAYFTHQWQVRTGSYLLFVLVLVSLGAMKYKSSLKPNLPELSEDPVPEYTWKNTLLSRKYIVIPGLALFLLAFVLGLLSQSEIKKIGIEKSGASKNANFPSIEKIRENWPAFRGPEGNGIAYHTDIPTEWDGESGKNILWKIPIPLHGYNSPIIWENKLFFSGADRKTQVVFCIDTDSGDILWQKELNDVPGSPDSRPNVSGDTGYAAPTMTTDGQNVFVLFATGDAACLDFTGKRIWAKNLGEPDNHYGHSSSLITYQDLLLVQYDQGSGGRLLGLKTAAGDLAFDKDRNVQISWASPILVNTGDRPEIILNSNPDVVSYDPLTGQELWRFKCMLGEIAPSPAYADGMVYVVNDYARLAAIKLGDTPELAWEYIDDLSEVSSPLATKDFVFMAASYGTVSCFDSKTGERFWYHDFDEGFYSSPILVGDNVYLIDMFGVTFIFKAGKEFQLLGQNALGEKAVSIPAFKQGRIYVRGEKHLFCIGKK